MKSTSKEPAFTIVDKRGQSRSEDTGIQIAVAPPLMPQELPAAGADMATWKGVGYMLAATPMGPNQLLVLGRAVGLRSDDKTFVGDYALMPIWPENLDDWRPKARERLDTFLHCDCSVASGTCALHRLYVAQWRTADQQRFEFMASQPMPEALEMYHRAEAMRAQSKIVVPR